MLKNLMLFCALLVLAGMPQASANGLTLSAFDSVSGVDTSDRMTFTVDISQSNSWRNTNSHDAVWVFMKYSTDAGRSWRHATLAGAGLNPAGFQVPAGFEIVVPKDEKGFFLRREGQGAGDIAVPGVRFVWNFAQDGLSAATARAANTLTRVYGIEMVYIPEGAFFAGDGASASPFHFRQGSQDDQPWYVASENAITTTGGATGGFYYDSSAQPGESASGEVFLLSNSFPKGFKAFYLMKYELSEGEWVSFFNTLTPEARIVRDVTSGAEGGKGADTVVHRNTVSWDQGQPYAPATTSRPGRAMTFLSWPDAAAFADWAGLRPVTELEFEKAARGADIAPVANEFAWGTADHVAAGSGDIYPAGADEVGAEAIVDGTANINRNTLGWTSGDGRAGGAAEAQSGALRNGIFAEASTNRRTSGAGYYGNMELSGNVAEPVVTVGRPEGRQFLGTHGDGDLTSLAGFEGNATNVDWPGINASDAARGVTATVGIGMRGGDFNTANIRDFQLSSRSAAARDADSSGISQRSSFAAGARFARTAP